MLAQLSQEYKHNYTPVTFYYTETNIEKREASGGEIWINPNIVITFLPIYYREFSFTVYSD